MNLNYEKQHKEGLCKVLGRSFVFAALYADFWSLSQIGDYHNLKLVGAYFSLLL